jgi:hypothetical protein
MTAQEEVRECETDSMLDRVVERVLTEIKLTVAELKGPCLSLWKFYTFPGRALVFLSRAAVTVIFHALVWCAIGIAFCCALSAFGPDVSNPPRPESKASSTAKPEPKALPAEELEEFRRNLALRME